MSDLIKQLTERRASVWEQAKSHLDAVEADNKRSLTDESGEDAQKWAAFTGELDQLDKRIEQLTDLEERAKKADEAREEFGGGAKPPAPTGEDRSAGDILRDIAEGRVRSHTFRAERRDLTAGTSTDGAELVPTTFYGRLIEHLVEVDAIRQAGATVLTTDSGETIQIPKTTSYSAASIVAEAGLIPESDPQFGQVELGAFKYGFIVEASSELLEDQGQGIDLEGFLARQGGRAIGLGSGAHFVNGDGSGKPQGVVGAATAGKTGAAAVAGAFTGDDLIDLFHSVIEPYRRGAAWLMRDATVGAARKLKDDNGQYLWQPSLQQGEPNTLLGKPIFTDPNVPAVAATARSVLFGDFSAYYIRDVNGIRVDVSPHHKFANDLIAWRFLFRTDGDLIDTTGAIKAFVGGAAS